MRTSLIFLTSVAAREVKGMPENVFLGTVMA